MGLGGWIGKKLEERRERIRHEEEKKERARKENAKHRDEIQPVLEKFTIKQLQNFCESYAGTLPEDEQYDPRKEGVSWEEEHDPYADLRPDKKKPRFKYPKRTLPWKKGGGAIKRRELVEFIWKIIEDGDITFDQLKDYALKNRIVHPSFFKTGSMEAGSAAELAEILGIIEDEFPVEKIKDEKELQSQLTVFLKTRLKKKVEREVPITDGWIDIVIDGKYALETKIPGDKTALRNLSAQIEEYLEEYPFLGVIIGDKTSQVAGLKEEDEFYDAAFEPKLTAKIKEYADRYKIKYGVRTVVFPITFRG